jgi:fructokinase
MERVPSSRHKSTLCAIEAGGTKFLCAVGSPSGDVLAETRILTGEPRHTIEQVLAFFRPHSEALAAIGIGSFGPVQLRRDASNYGFITSTPKTAWRNFDLVGAIRGAFDLPIGFDTDVNAAALAESCWGAARGLRTFLYVTVGTGIGGGVMVEGALLHGMMHPETGHIRVPHDLARDPFPGACPYHGDCLEGLASGVAMEQRWGIAPMALPSGHPGWALEADYLAAACANWICTLSPQRLILGGGVMQPHLVPLIRARVVSLMNGYIDTPDLAAIESYIVPSPLGGRAGLLGALALAARAAATETRASASE